MKSIITIVAITLFGFLPVTFVHGQTSPKAAAGEKQAATAGAGKRTDVYHVQRPPWAKHCNWEIG